MSSPPSNNHRKSVYCLTIEISNQRKTANHLRRVYQRNLKRAGPNSYRNEKEEPKTAKFYLVKLIKKTKDEKWESLCDEEEHDSLACLTSW